LWCKVIAFGVKRVISLFNSPFANGRACKLSVGLFH
jgi:hypothetical protein